MEKSKAGKLAKVTDLVGINDRFREVAARSEGLAAMPRKPYLLSFTEWQERAVS